MKLYHIPEYYEKQKKRDEAILLTSGEIAENVVALLPEEVAELKRAINMHMRQLAIEYNCSVESIWEKKGMSPVWREWWN